MAPSATLNDIKKTKNRDKGILIIAAFLAIISFLTSISTHVWLGQLFYLILAGVAMFTFSKIKYSNLSRFGGVGLIAAFILLLLTRILGGFDARSIEIGSFQVQTMYLIGFLLTFYYCRDLTIIINQKIEGKIKENPLSRGKTIFYLCILFICCGLIFTSKQSTALILFLICCIIMLIGGVKIKSIITAIAIALLLIFCITYLNLFRTDTLVNRITYWWTGELTTEKIAESNNLSTAEIKELERYYKEYGEQMIYSQAMIARANWLPIRVGEAQLKDRIPAAKNDYVFAVIVEEFGIIIGIFVLFLYLFLLFRSIRIAQHTQGIFGKLLATSIGLWISLLAIIHIAVNCGLMPATGETLPLISNGGVGIVFTGILLGILLNISKYSDLEENIIS